ncbi:hypothetical protein DEU56DRAFT_90973 [Suillus clintonianus]|uniref:uncharacterized protein n=1 Tax=Suillus clintonianus TaxID=1904413 RepID=UPI001B8850B7|nr:uncharacterized protein DEU56DRAFT_90973 [Suillus clintonianus]KAG2121876.1 hypothetical protein DEU56DRAFT_90973 [Suillus clintonianus]
MISQLIQSQNHAMQAIQDQQHSILTAVLPLLPLTQAFPLHVDQLKTSIADNVSSSMSSLSRDIDGMKSTLSSLSARAPSDTIRGVYQPALGLTPPRRSGDSTRKRANSWLDRGDTVPGPSQTNRSHSFAPMHSPRIDRHKKPRLDSILPTGSPRLMKQTSHTANPPEKYALDLRGSSNADGLVSPARGLVTNNGYPAAPRPKHSTRMPLADILPSALVNKVTASPKPVDSVPPSANEKYRKRTTESPPRVLPIPPQPISKAIKLEEVLRSPLRCYISIPPSPLSSLSPSPSPAPAQSVLKNQVHHATGGIARRQVTFAAPSQTFTSSTLPGPAVPSLPTLDSMSASMSLRDRRAQMSMVSTSACSRDGWLNHVLRSSGVLLPV